MGKTYKLKSENIERLVPDIGFAFATDMITVEGKKVDYMERHKPDGDGDSGWIFYGGGETQEYLDDPDNTSMLSVNKIANYDPEIIEFLTYPPGTEIERNEDGRLQVISQGISKPEVVFLPPVDVGHIKVTKNWGFNICSHMLKRIDKGSLVIWRPGFTIWLDSYDANGVGLDERIDRVMTYISPDRTAFLESRKGGVHKIRYHLQEVEYGKEQNAVYVFALTESRELHMAIYYDNPSDLSEIEEIWKTLVCIGA